MAQSKHCYITIKNSPLGISIKGILQWGYESYVVWESDGMGQICTLPVTELPKHPNNVVYEDDTVRIRI